MSFWRQAIELAATDLRAELRRGEVLLVTIPFGAVALLLIPFAIGIDAPLLRRIGIGVYWVVVLLFGMLVALRRSAELSGPQRDLLAMLGIDPAARFAGSAAATAALQLAFATVLLPVALILYDATVPGWPLLFALLPLVATALGLLATLLGALAAGSRGAVGLVPLLVAPLAIPILLGATQALDGLQDGQSILGWILLLVLMNLILSVAGVLTAQPLQESAA